VDDDDGLDFDDPAGECGLDEDFGEPSLDIPFGELFVENALGFRGRFLGVLRLDDLAEPDSSAEAGLDDSTEHGLTILLEVGLSPSADDGLFLCLPNISASHCSAGSQF
jgi:hypothetical protein